MRVLVSIVFRLTLVLGAGLQANTANTVYAQSAKSLEERGIGQGRKQSDKGSPAQPALKLRPGSNEAKTKADAESGDPKAMYDWGLWLEQGGTGKPDLVAAAKWFKDAAEKDYPAAKTALGNAYYYARGLDQDLDKALRWYQRAADDNDPTAMHNLGVIYEHGASTLGIDKDEAEALKWFARSSDASLALAKGQTDDAIGWNLSYFAEQSRKSIERIERNRKLLEVAANDLSEIDLVEIQKRADNGDAAAMFELV